MENYCWNGSRTISKTQDSIRCWPAASPVSCSACFRLRQGEDATRELMRRINASGRFFVSHTVLDSRFTIRAAIGNIRTEQRDVEELWIAIAEALDPPE